jgi:Spy/CpxP family protein refolding chaperone
MTGRMKQVLAAAAVAVVAVAGATSVLAQGGPGGFGHRRFGGGFGRGEAGLPLRELELTEEQRTQVKGIFEQHRDEVRRAGERVRAAFRAQQDVVTAIPVDEGAIRSASAALATAQADAGIVRARIHSAVFQVLTPEQQQKAQQLRTERQERMKQARERFQQRRPQRPPQAPPQQPQL